MEECTKTRLVLGREIQESPVYLLLHFSPSKLVTKIACLLYQCIASHMTTMNKGGGAKGDEYGIFKTKSYSLLLDELFNDSKYTSLPCVINNLATIRKTGFIAAMNISARSCANRNTKAD